jgi:hypothetical protein
MTKTDEIMDQYRLCGDLRIDPFSVVSGKLDGAEAKLQAMIDDARKVPDGWKLVPVEPDELSIQAGCLEQSDSYYKSYKKLADLCSFVVVNQLRNLVIRGYKSMLSAAPEYKE